MKPETITALQQLVQAAGSRRELLLDAGQGMVRIDLKPEDVALWHDNLSSQPQGTNLLLACESQGGELSQTRLSWVVGAAIRPTQVENGEQALAVLQQLGSSSEQTQQVSLHCPGLGSDLTWAFYLDRHGWLSASPISADAQLRQLLGQAD